MPTKKVIVAANAHVYLIDSLIEKGFDVISVPNATDTELATLLTDAQGLIVTTRVIHSNMIDQAPLLKWIGRLGSGMELIDVAHANTKGIQCYSSPEGNSNAVAEHAIGMLLSLLHRINVSNEEIKEGKWNREANRGTELAGKTVGIIGFGNTGSNFAKCLASFEVTILAYDKYKKGFGNQQVKETDLQTLLKEADIISFHLPLSTETKYFCDEALLQQMNKQPWLLNTSRGEVIDTKALILALQKGRLKGACLDVLENEKIDSLSVQQTQELEFLNSRSDVLLTPHIAGYSQEALYKMAKVLLEKIIF
ncbi:MAG: NAD(P)-dependent oxidoreductase [Chitinophagaceae bacterium]